MTHESSRLAPRLAVIVLLTAVGDCFCNCALLYGHGTDKTKMLPQAVQDSSAGQQQAAELRETLRAEAKAQVATCLDDAKSTAAELREKGDVARSLIKGGFIEQDTAMLLCGPLHVTIYVIAHAATDHFQVTKYAGETLFHTLNSSLLVNTSLHSEQPWTTLSSL